MQAASKNTSVFSHFISLTFLKMSSDAATFFFSQHMLLLYDRKKQTTHHSNIKGLVTLIIS